MHVTDLKRYIYENQKIEYILEKIGCHNIKYNESKEYYSSCQPTGDNPQGVNIRNNEHLNYRSFSRNVSYDDGKDLISLIEDVKKLNFRKALKYIHELLGLKFTWKYEPIKKEKNTIYELDLFKEIRDKTKYGIVDVADINVLDEEYLNDFMPMLHIDWIRQGITEKTRKKFGLCYSYRYKRVIIPVRAWNTGELVATNARTTVENFEEFGIKKYYLTNGYNKSLNLYGLWENYDSIQKAGYVVVYEAEKSVLKRDSLGDSTGVAVSGHTLSNEQAAILWGLNVDIVFSFDKDVCLQEVWHCCQKVWHGRNVYYIHDKNNILSPKDSPADARNKDYQFLFENRIKYDNEKHQLYLKSLEK